MKKLNILLKITFHLFNLILILLYLYPGSIFGYLIYGDLNKQPQITNDFFYISSNHLYIFMFFTTLAIIAYSKNNKFDFWIKYIFFLSIILELTHIIIPERSFQAGDILGNFFGVLLIFVLYKIYKKKKV